jgi:hypothetical protein
MAKKDNGNGWRDLLEKAKHVVDMFRDRARAQFTRSAIATSVRGVEGIGREASSNTSERSRPIEAAMKGNNHADRVDELARRDGESPRIPVVARSKPEAR